MIFKALTKVVCIFLLTVSSIAYSEVRILSSDDFEIVYDYFQQVDKKRVGRGVYEYTYKFAIKNTSNYTYDGVSIKLQSKDNSVVSFKQNIASFDKLEPGETGMSVIDIAFTLDRTKSFDWDSFEWEVFASIDVSDQMIGYLTLLDTYSPASNANVEVVIPNEETIYTQTDQNGEWVINNFTYEGKYLVNASTNDYKGSKTHDTTFPDSNFIFLEKKDTLKGTINGKVVLPDNTTPAQFIKLEIKFYDTNKEYSTMTDSNGDFSVQTTLDGQFGLFALHPEKNSFKDYTNVLNEGQQSVTDTIVISVAPEHQPMYKAPFLFDEEATMQEEALKIRKPVYSDDPKFKQPLINSISFD